MLIGCYQGTKTIAVIKNKTMLIGCYQGTKQQRC